MKTKIGIVVCATENQKQFVSDAYIQAVKAAKGLPLLIPLVKSKPAIEEYVSFCDGFLFCGGDDITPLLFGQEPAVGIRKTDISLDLFQIRLMKAILEKEKPILAICRGMQVLNVACSGSIHQDISGFDEIINHMQTSMERKDISHKVSFTPRTKVARLLGDFAYTNSFHHQAIDKLGKGLIVSGQTGDGIIEAIEMPSHPFTVGVQWHPENMYETSSHMKLLFHALVQHAKTP